MRVSVINNAPSEWAGAVSDLLVQLQREYGVASNRATAVGEGDADFYFWLGADVGQLAQQLELASPSALSRTIVIGPALGYLFGKPRPAPGTVADLLERHRLAGAFDVKALLDWESAPSFAGPKELMDQFGTNAVKAFQSEHYANWFGPREKTMAEFLAAFLAAMVPPDAPATPSRLSPSELESALRATPTPLLAIQEDSLWLRLGWIRVSKRSALVDVGIPRPSAETTRFEIERFDKADRRGWAIVLVDLDSMPDTFVGWVGDSDKAKASQWVDRLNATVRGRLAAAEESIERGKTAEWMIFQQGAEYAPDSPWGIETIEVSRTGELSYERRRAGEVKAAIQGRVDAARVLELHEQLAKTAFPASPHRTFPPGASISRIITHPPFLQALINSSDGLKLPGFGDMLRALVGLCDALRKQDAVVLREWRFEATDTRSP